MVTAQKVEVAEATNTHYIVSGDNQGTQEIRNIPCSGKLVSFVEFESWDDKTKMSVSVLVHWTKALEYLRKTHALILRVHWADPVPSVDGPCQDLQRCGRGGASWGSWNCDRYSGQELFTITVGGSRGTPVLKETGFEPRK